MNIDNRFIFFKTRSAFEEALNANSIKYDSIVFIAEDNVIWTHGVMFGGAGSNLENYATKEYVQELFNNIEIDSDALWQRIVQYVDDKISNIDSSNLNTSCPKHIILEESEYDRLTEYEDNAIYFVLEPTRWVFGNRFPATFVEYKETNWTFGDKFPGIFQETEGSKGDDNKDPEESEEPEVPKEPEEPETPEDPYWTLGETFPLILIKHE